MKEWGKRLGQIPVQPGEVVCLEGDSLPEVCALLLALIENQNVIVPLTSAAFAQREEFHRIAQVQVSFRTGGDRQERWERFPVRAGHPLLKQLRDSGQSGLVLFSSGSAGEPKAAVHRVDRLLEKFRTPRHRVRTLFFLLWDHIGGLNTLFYTLANGGTLVSVEDRLPETICRTIQRHRVELLPTSPSFLNLLLLSGEHLRWDLSCLKWITYGTEPMPETTLRRGVAAFPQARFQQTYGLSELGILRSQSKDSSSLWVKLGGEGFETKVVDNVLWVRAQSAMMGYLNAPSPFDAEGWFDTEDLVEVEGEFFRILGRRTDLINVGGEKVYPAQVESVLLAMDNVRDVTVRGERNAVLGQIVVARFSLIRPEGLEALKSRMREHCRDKLARYQIPLRVEIAREHEMGPRFKKIRSSVQPARETLEARPSCR